MPHAITAIYENGVFVPKAKVALPEHAKVKLSISAISSRPKKKRPIEAFFDLGSGGNTTDGSDNHDTYLYGDAAT